MLYPHDARINVLAPIVRGRKGEFKKELRRCAPAASPRPASTASSIARRGHQARSPPQSHHRRRRRSPDRASRASSAGWTESVEIALGLADDIVVINTLDGGDRLFSRKLACVDCGISMPEMTPRAFSFNSPHGACPECQGLGAIYDFDPRRVVPDDSLSLEGRHRPWARAIASSSRKALAG